MTKRGKVVRDPCAGPGLLMVDGQQHPFILQNVWKSEVPPKPGQVVELEFDAEGKIAGITTVPDAQIAQEQADITLAATKTKGAESVRSLVGRFEFRQSAAAGLLILSWSLLSAVSVQLPFLGRLDLTFWQVLGYLNSTNVVAVFEQQSNPSSGFYGLLALAAMAGPFAHHVWKDKRAELAGAMPLAFMLLVGVLVRRSVHSSFASGGAYGGLQKQAQDEMLNAVSLGLGTYISLLVSGYFAALSTRRFFVSKASKGKQLQPSERVAA